jgi:hypothetical protein
MLRTVAVLGIFGSLAVVTASVVGAVGCSSSKSSGTGTTPSDDEVECVDGGSGLTCTGPAASSTTVSFAQDIQPIFQGSCGVGGATCHGSYPGSTGAQGLYLGEPLANDDGVGDAGAILSGIVGKASLEAPSLDIVSAGNPSESYLMHKVDGDMASLGSACLPVSTSFPNAITQPCGVQMPQSSPALPASKATLIWQWIAQGAKNN